jgi:hypothetical protein
MAMMQQPELGLLPTSGSDAPRRPEAVETRGQEDQGAGWWHIDPSERQSHVDSPSGAPRPEPGDVLVSGSRARASRQSFLSGGH